MNLFTVNRVAMPDLPVPLPPNWFEILVSLADGDMHGYAMLQDIEARTQGAVVMLPGTLYRALERLLEHGLIREVAAPAGESDPRRRYYRLTATGRRAAHAEGARLWATLTEARRRHLLDGGAV
jgi:DNA-binding PadR family transcriptional regulator